jgi:hypothetical protein
LSSWESQKPKVIIIIIILLLLLLLSSLSSLSLSLLSSGIVDLFPDILTHLGPKQMSLLKEILGKQMQSAVNKTDKNTIPE